MEHGLQALVLNVEEACNALRISRATLYRLFRQKKLKSLNVGSRRLVRAEELVRFVKSAEG